jgi:putative transposase
LPIKAVRFRYASTPQTRDLLERFRVMINHAIHLCLEENIRGRLKLRDRIYKEFRARYGVLSPYPYSVAEVAWSIVKKHRRWHRRPLASQLMLKMDAQSYTVKSGICSLPFKKGERLLIPLLFGDWQRSFLMDESLKRGSLTMTEDAIVMTFSKEVPTIEPLRKVGYDLNEKSIVGSDGTRIDLSEVARLHTAYGVRRRDFYSAYSDDRRLQQKYAGNQREKERVKQLLNRVSKQIIDQAKEKQRAVVLERLKVIRYSHQKRNGESRAKRRRISLWPFRQLQSYIEYKAGWEGVPIEYVSPTNTSKTCSSCGYLNRGLKMTERSWLCPQCGCRLDRDLNAAVNIERRGKIPCLGVVRPGAQDTDEAVKGNPTTPVILRAEALKLMRLG